MFSLALKARQILLVSESHDWVANNETDRHTSHCCLTRTIKSSAFVTKVLNVLLGMTAIFIFWYEKKTDGVCLTCSFYWVCFFHSVIHCVQDTQICKHLKSVSVVMEWNGIWMCWKKSLIIYSQKRQQPLFFLLSSTNVMHIKSK